MPTSVRVTLTNLVFAGGQPLGTGEVGGAYDCGHYRSTGSAAHLRFDERNAHAQRKVCNRWGAGPLLITALALWPASGWRLLRRWSQTTRPRKMDAGGTDLDQDEYRKN